MLNLQGKTVSLRARGLKTPEEPGAELGPLPMHRQKSEIIEHAHHGRLVYQAEITVPFCHLNNPMHSQSLSTSKDVLAP